ncbi:hypothetical protein UA08_04934 [Talaromyces atroroseus]|uniref:FAD-binding domain-containing protein n=1 Tax=Talaromyces atroroseus TaxID=1441469 RepID=A0A225AWG0_TALAT|nr:hypothetical protein UA08_04934 [Talaromyces atroroseus]OKL59949.1 hypothetical protein UA08_04934 [Talaromyces atroroseus]
MAQLSSSQDEFHIAIVGAGIGGLTAGIALTRLLPSTVRVSIFEQARELREIGASIGIGPNGLRSLEKLGVDASAIDEVSFRQPDNRPFVYLHWQTGEVLKQTVHHNVSDRRHAMARFHRAHLQRLLLEKLPKGVKLHLSKRVKAVQVKPEQNGQGGVILTFEDRTTINADLLIGADGIHSSVRKTFVPDHTLRWTGGVTLRSTFDASLVEGIEGLPQNAVFYFGRERSLFASRLGKGQYTVVGSYQSNVDDPEDPYYNAKWNSEGDLETLRSYYKGWHPVAQALVNVVPYTRIFPNEMGVPLKSMTFHGRVVLIGDAGHTHGGAFAAGGALAINDAHALALALTHVWRAENQSRLSAHQLAQGLDLFDKTRRPHVNRLIELVQRITEPPLDAPKPAETAEESDEDFRKMISSMGDENWIAEHDVEAAFQAVLRDGDSAKL